jgi:hypothetical protein
MFSFQGSQSMISATTVQRASRRIRFPPGGHLDGLQVRVVVLKLEHVNAAARVAARTFQRELERRGTSIAALRGPSAASFRTWSAGGWRCANTE